MKIIYYTNKGNTRKDNQDSILINTKLVSKNNMKNYKYLNIQRKKYLMFIADGMGGLKHGCEASHLALDVFKKIKFPFSKDNIIEKIYEIKDKFDFDNILDKLELGTTIGGVLFNENGEGYIVNIGDTRVYKFKNNKINKINEDHSYVAQLIKEKKLPKDADRYHNSKNLLTSSIIGNPNKPINKIYIDNFKLENNEYILICSDGIWELFTDDELNNVFKENNQKKISETLIKRSEQRSKDNVSFIIIKK